MGKKGGSRHLKRLPAPAFWPIHVKEAQWVSRPNPGPHKKDLSFPIILILREMLGLARTRKEGLRILTEGHIKVDGVIQRDDKYPVGLMDVVEIPTVKKAFRILPKPKKKLGLHLINEEEKEFKLCKIMNKTSVKGGNLQLNLHDGRNILIRVADSKHPVEDVYKTRDVLKIKIPGSEILEHLNLEEGIISIVENGKNVGRWGKIVEVEERFDSTRSIVTLEDSQGEKFKTTLAYVFPIGRDESWISLSEE